MAKLDFRHSPMNAGKSTQLLQVAHNYERNGGRVVIAKPGIDTKGDLNIVSRLGVERPVDVLLAPSDDARARILAFGEGLVRCALVDEAQFLTPEQVMGLRQLVDMDNIPVIAFGLRTDFQRKAFPGSIALFELADVFSEIKTVCSCLKRASFNARYVNGQMVVEGNQVAIDGENEVEYKPLCSKCYSAGSSSAS